MSPNARAAALARPARPRHHPDARGTAVLSGFAARRLPPRQTTVYPHGGRRRPAIRPSFQDGPGGRLHASGRFQLPGADPPGPPAALRLNHAPPRQTVVCPRLRYSHRHHGPELAHDRSLHPPCPATAPSTCLRNRTACHHGKPRFTITADGGDLTSGRHFWTVLASAFTPAAASSLPARIHQGRPQPYGSASAPLR